MLNLAFNIRVHIRRIFQCSEVAKQILLWLTVCNGLIQTLWFLNYTYKVR